MRRILILAATAAVLEGDVSAVDTFVVFMEARDGDRAVCHFAPEP